MAPGLPWGCDTANSVGKFAGGNQSPFRIHRGSETSNGCGTGRNSRRLPASPLIPKPPSGPQETAAVASPCLARSGWRIPIRSVRLRPPKASASSDRTAHRPPRDHLNSREKPGPQSRPALSPRSTRRTIRASPKRISSPVRRKLCFYRMERWSVYRNTARNRAWLATPISTKKGQRFSPPALFLTSRLKISRRTFPLLRS